MWHVLAIYNESEEGLFFDITEQPEVDPHLTEGERVLEALPLALDEASANALEIVMKIDGLARSPHGQSLMMELVRTGYNYGRRSGGIAAI